MILKLNDHHIKLLLHVDFMINQLCDVAYFSSNLDIIDKFYFNHENYEQKLQKLFWIVTHSIIAIIIELNGFMDLYINGFN